MASVALYARFSSENQRDASIDDQVRICRVRAEREGWQVVSVQTDYALSGASTLRPGYQQLLELIRRSGTDIVLAESLDRFSRDQEHIAGFFKQAQFAGVKIVTLAEGEITELHIGLKGTMGALFLKDLADKTRRGLEGRVRQGRSGGGVCYGYRVVRGIMGRDGEPERGLREIDPAQAEVVRRVFRSFADGESPITIARQLNDEGIASPRGGPWSDGALRGHVRIGTGLLRNELYVGRLVWNRRRWIKDPTTGRRVARDNGSDNWITEEVPELRIIDLDLWDKVQRRLADAARPRKSLSTETPGSTDYLWHYRRAPTLLSGKIVCGHCGGSYTTTGKDYMACKAAIKQGICSNQVRIRRTRLESQVLTALGRDLMCPEAVEAFVAEFTASWNRLQAGASGKLESLRRELEATDRKLDSLIEAIADGLRAPGLQGKLDALGQRQEELRLAIADAQSKPVAPRLHPNLAAVYRAKIARLQEAMAGEGGRAILETLRELIDHVTVSAPLVAGGEPRLELVGHLTALLRAGGAEGLPVIGHAKSPLAVANGLVGDCSTLVDAGTGFEPVTFRL